MTRKDEHEEHRIPLVREEIEVGKRWVEGDRVRVTTRTVTEDQQVQELLRRQVVKVDRVSIDQVVDSIPQQRAEGNTLIIPVVEEVLVVEKRLVLREEIHITTVETETPFEETVTVRRSEVNVERSEPDA